MPPGQLFTQVTILDWLLKTSLQTQPDLRSHRTKQFPFNEQYKCNITDWWLIQVIVQEIARISFTILYLLTCVYDYRFDLHYEIKCAKVRCVQVLGLYPYIMRTCCCKCYKRFVLCWINFWVKKSASLVTVLTAKNFPDPVKTGLIKVLDSSGSQLRSWGPTDLQILYVLLVCLS